MSKHINIFLICLNLFSSQLHSNEKSDVVNDLQVSNVNIEDKPNLVEKDKETFKQKAAYYLDKLANVSIASLIIPASRFFLINSSKKQIEIKTIKSDIKGISGSIPVAFDDIIKILNSNTKVYCNRLFLYGSQGNGKTLLSHKFAEATNSELIEINGSELTKEPMASDKIKKVFQDAISRNKKVVILFDDADVVIKNASSTPAAQSFWLWLDDVKNNSNIFVIVVSNKLPIKEKAFIGRFGMNILEITNPNGMMRKEIINFYIQKINTEIDKNFTLEENAILKLVKNTKGLSIKDIQQFIYNLHKDPALINIKSKAVSQVLKNISLKHSSVELSTAKV